MWREPKGLPLVRSSVTRYLLFWLHNSEYYTQYYWFPCISGWRYALLLNYLLNGCQVLCRSTSVTGLHRILYKRADSSPAFTSPPRYLMRSQTFKDVACSTMGLLTKRVYPGWQLLTGGLSTRHLLILGEMVCTWH